MCDRCADLPSRFISDSPNEALEFLETISKALRRGTLSGEDAGLFKKPVRIAVRCSTCSQSFELTQASSGQVEWRTIERQK